MFTPGKDLAVDEAIMMYTSCDPTKSSTVMRRKKDGTRDSVTCPVAIKVYNEKMGGVD